MLKYCVKKYDYIQQLYTTNHLYGVNSFTITFVPTIRGLRKCTICATITNYKAFLFVPISYKKLATWKTYELEGC